MPKESNMFWSKIKKSNYYQNILNNKKTIANVDQKIHKIHVLTTFEVPSFCTFLTKKCARISSTLLRFLPPKKGKKHVKNVFFTPKKRQKNVIFGTFWSKTPKTSKTGKNAPQKSTRIFRAKPSNIFKPSENLWRGHILFPKKGRKSKIAKISKKWFFGDLKLL